MPSGRGADVAIDTSLCRRCQSFEPVIDSRGQPLCAGCFCRYISSKVVKRIEPHFRVRELTPGAERMLLLPLSLGYNSCALLHILSQHLKGQAQKSGRTGYQLHVLNVNEDGDSAATWDAVQSRYPEHVYSSCQLSDVIDDEDVSALLKSVAQGPDDGNGPAKSHDRSESLAQALAFVSSASSRADLQQILRQRLIVRFARDNNCEAILWGHSTTTLAERTLAETAKGRGFSLAWLAADGASPQGEPFYYPVQDLLSKELAAYASLADPAFDDLVLKEIVKPAVSTKNTTIDELMRQYFATVENEYPAIVANVVKTSGKLVVPDASHYEQHCELCEMPLEGQAPDKSRLCYGCIRILPTVTS